MISCWRFIKKRRKGTKKRADMQTALYKMGVFVHFPSINPHAGEGIEKYKTLVWKLA